MILKPKFKNNAKVGITDTTLRDAHQSLYATRMTTADMLKVAAYLDNVGFYSMEVWGGATFDSCLRFLKEDPWERLRTMTLRAAETAGYQGTFSFHHSNIDICLECNFLYSSSRP